MKHRCSSNSRDGHSSIGRRVWGLLEGITEETSLRVLTLPVPVLHCWCSRPRGGTLEPVLATTTGRRATWLSLIQHVALPWPSHCVHVKLNKRHVESTSRWMYFTLNVRHVECTANQMYVTLHVLYIECTSHTMHVTFDACHIWCTSHWMHVTLNVRHIECTSHWMYVIMNVRHIECMSHSMVVQSARIACFRGNSILFPSSGGSKHFKHNMIANRCRST